MSDQDRILPYNIYTISGRQVMRIEKKYWLGDYKLIQYQILQTNITRAKWQTLRRIIMNEILGVKGLTFLHDEVGKPQSNLAFLDQLQCDNQRLFGNINFSAFKVLALT